MNNDGILHMDEKTPHIHATIVPIDGSLAKHISTMQYYKELIEQQDSLQENIETLLGLEEESQKRLKQV